MLAIGGSEGELQLWDIGEPTEPSRVGPPLVGPSSLIQWAAFSPDGGQVVATTNAGQAWVWDITDRAHPREHAVLGPIDGGLFGVGFNPRGDTIMAGGTNARVNVWSLDVESVADRVCGDLGDPLTEDEWSQHVRGSGFQDPCAG